MVTRRPRSFSRRPRLEAVSPLPRLDATPPVTKRCLVSIGRDARADAAKIVSRGRCDAGDASAPRTLRITAAGNRSSHRHMVARGAPRATTAYWLQPLPLWPSPVPPWHVVGGVNSGVVSTGSFDGGLRMTVLCPVHVSSQLSSAVFSG